MITTVGGGVFGVVSAATSALGGGGGAAGEGTPQKAAECEVRSKVLYCTGTKTETKLYRQRAYDSEVVHKLAAGTSSRYSCWGHGAPHSGGNDIWYWTHFKGEDYWGNAPTVAVNTNKDPAPGLPECS
ncbi:hypothetical protein [Streptomyces sp. NPDC093707]|uniref:hypothetical protein n=1 Tax=Streptomyces sp. NPDC093707 TaxID=3154984 RepID=UPI00344C3280